MWGAPDLCTAWTNKRFSCLVQFGDHGHGNSQSHLNNQAGEEAIRLERGGRGSTHVSIAMMNLLYSTLLICVTNYTLCY